jgi:hypothetical protein
MEHSADPPTQWSSLLKNGEKVLTENELLHVPHPLYSPELAPPDFWLFGRIKTGLAGRSFAEPEENSGFLGGGSSMRARRSF